MASREAREYAFNMRTMKKSKESMPQCTHPCNVSTYACPLSLFLQSLTSPCFQKCTHGINTFTQTPDLNVVRMADDEADEWGSEPIAMVSCGGSHTAAVHPRIHPTPHNSPDYHARTLEAQIHEGMQTERRADRETKESKILEGR